MDEPVNKNLEALANIRQIEHHSNGEGLDFALELETKDGFVEFRITPKGRPTYTLRFDGEKATSLGVSFLAMADKLGYHY